jgi:Tropinone reductase 1
VAFLVTSSKIQEKMDKRWSLQGMNALVTGGTKGIGEAVVEELSILGARVHTCARDETQLQERLREWQEKGFQVTTSICDVSLREQREKLMETVSSLFQGKLNILVSVYILASPPRAWDLQEPNHVVFLITFFFFVKMFLVVGLYISYI